MAEVIEEAIEGLEVTNELVDDISETVRNVPNAKLLLLGGFVTGITFGAGLGYLVATRRLETKYSQIAEEEIEGMRKHFEARTLARMEKPPLEEVTAPAKADTIAVVQGYKETGTVGTTEVPAPPVVPPTETPDEQLPPVASHYPAGNVFDNEPDPSEVNAPVWDYAVETKLRLAVPEAPYVIHRNELGEMDGWDCTTYTYYAGDDVLTDERDQEVRNRDEMVNGNVSLNRFGHGSNDPNVVFVRNEKINQEFEIVRSDGRYVKEVLGFDDEEGALQHMDHHTTHRRGRRPRWDDDPRDS